MKPVRVIASSIFVWLPLDRRQGRRARGLTHCLRPQPAHFDPVGHGLRVGLGFPKDSFVL